MNFVRAHLNMLAVIDINRNCSAMRRNYFASLLKRVIQIIKGPTFFWTFPESVYVTICVPILIDSDRSPPKLPARPQYHPFPKAAR
jgi:hypothetical protein